MRYPTAIDHGRLLSVVAVCLCSLVLGVSATALDASLSPSAAPTPPDGTPSADVSLYALFYLLLDAVLSLFGASLGDVRGGASGASAVRPLLAAIHFLYQYRLPLLSGIAALTVIGLGLQHRHRIARPDLLHTPDDSPTRPRSEPAHEWPGATPSHEVARAWIELTDHVELSAPHVRTPGEWQRAAIEHGLHPPAVRTITEAFRAAAYGTEPVTRARRRDVRRAVSELRSERGDATE